MCEGLLTESSCVCGLGEIFWHFPVDIESEKKKKQGTKKKVRGSERKKKRKCKHCVLRKGAHSVPIRLCVITEDWWNVSSGPVLLQVQTASHKTYTHTQFLQGYTSSFMMCTL